MSALENHAGSVQLTADPGAARMTRQQTPLIEE